MGIFSMPGLLRGGICLLLLTLVVGCGGGPQNASKPVEESNLKQLSRLYGQFIARNKGQAPADEAAFKAFLTKLTPDELKGAGVTVASADALLISNRDNQPYVVMYAGATLGPAKGPGNRPIIAYEKVGVEGKRFVASDLGAEEVDEAKFKELVPNAK